jgi:hypothetical protein
MRAPGRLAPPRTPKVIEVTQMSIMTTVKAGKGNHHGVVSELSAFLAVKPGHADELRRACGRFQRRLSGDQRTIQKLGLRDMRHVILDEGRRLLWVTAFETDWDPYIDDSVDILGVQAWIDWLQHTVEWRDEVGESHCAMKDFIQSAQVKAAWYFNALADLTMDEIRRALQVQQAFQQVLDDPAAEQVLTQPVLAPLLRVAPE